MISPFKFLDSYTRDDQAIFFGRDREIEELYQKVFESKIMLVYGISGTGKSSLIHCGLADKFSDSDWLPVNIRRGGNMMDSLARTLSSAAITPLNLNTAKEGWLKKGIRSLYLDHFKPLFLIFDQFEELFIFGSKTEKEEFIKVVKGVVESNLQCRFLFVIREEYLAGITEFEKQISTILSNRVRIEKMTRVNAQQAIEGPCKFAGIEVEQKFSETLLEKLSPNSLEVELTYLQVYLDKIFRTAISQSSLRADAKQSNISSQEKDSFVHQGGLGMTFSMDVLEKLGDVKDLLGNFLEEQIAQLPEPETALVVLKAFVSTKGTKRQVTEEDVLDYSRTLGKNISIEALRELILRFVTLRILRDKDESGRYELRHDALASKIYEKITMVEKELLEVRQFIENAYDNYQRRKIMLSASDLSYIAPYEDKMFLSGQLAQFVEQSKKEIHKNRKRKRNIAIAAIILLLIVFSGFSIWALKEREKAKESETSAIEERNKAIEANKQVKIAKQETDSIRKLKIVPFAVVSLIKMNALYIGIDNPISVAVVGYPADKVSITGKNLNILPSDDGCNYIVRPNSLNNASVSVYIKEDDEMVKLGQMEFRVQRILDPIFMIGNNANGRISNKTLLESKPIIYINVFDLNFIIQEFTIRINDSSIPIISKGAEFSSAQKDAIRKSKIGDLIVFEKIKIQGPDGKVRQINDAVFIIGSP